MTSYAKVTGGFVDAIYGQPSEADIEAFSLVPVPGFVRLPPRPSGSHKLVIQGDTVVWHDPRTFEQIQNDKRLEIDGWRLKANSEGFTYQGKRVSTDTLSMLDISNAASQISSLQAMPLDWPGGWKAKEGFIPISTVAEWNAFFNAMYSQGLANFNKARALKDLVNTAEDAQFIKDLTWDSL